MQHVVEASKQSRIEKVGMVGGGDDEAVRAVLLDHLKKAVQHPSDFAHIVCKAALRADGVELVEKNRCREFGRWRRKSASQLRGRLPHELRDEAVESHLEKWTDQVLLARTEAVSVLPVPGGPTRSSLRLGARPCSKIRPAWRCSRMTRWICSERPFPRDHFSQPRLRIGNLQEVCQLASRAADRHRQIRAATALGLIDHRAEFFGELAVTQPRFMGRNLHGDREEAILVTFKMRLQQRLELLGASHEASLDNGLGASYLEHLHCLVVALLG